MGESLVTEVHEAADENHTRLHWMMRVQTPETRAMMADPQHRPMFEQSAAEFKQSFERSLARLAEILQQVMAARLPEGGAAGGGRRGLKKTAAPHGGAGRGGGPRRSCTIISLLSIGSTPSSVRNPLDDQGDPLPYPDAHRRQPVTS